LFKRIPFFAVLLLGLAPTAAPAADVEELVNQLTQSLTEDLQRQRLKAQQQDAEDPLRRASDAIGTAIARAMGETL
jgi:hypothetical protein